MLTFRLLLQTLRHHVCSVFGVSDFPRRAVDGSGVAEGSDADLRFRRRRELDQLPNPALQNHHFLPGHAAASIQHERDPAFGFGGSGRERQIDLYGFRGGRRDQSDDRAREEKRGAPTKEWRHGERAAFRV